MKEIPFLFLMALAALPQARPAEMERMTAALGYGRILGFLHAVMPSLYRQIRLAVLAVLAYATAVVDVALILGPTTPAPLAVRILEWQNDPDLDLRLVAAAGAVLQIGVTGAAILVWLAAERALDHPRRPPCDTGWRARADAWLRRLGAALDGRCPALVVLAGIALLALWSVAGPWRFPDLAARLPHARRLDARRCRGLAMPLRDTVVLAAVSCLAAVTLALGVLEFAARSGRGGIRRVLDLLYVPLIVPQVAFLFGLQILFTAAALRRHLPRRGARASRLRLPLRAAVALRAVAQLGSALRPRHACARPRPRCGLLARPPADACPRRC